MTFGKQGDGFAITGIALKTHGEVPGIDAAAAGESSNSRNRSRQFAPSCAASTLWTVAAGSGGALMLRVPAAESDRVRARKHVGPMVMRGRELSGWVLVDGDGCRTARQLDSWIGLGLSAARNA